jgi:predicted metal-dependent hydrolase
MACWKIAGERAGRIGEMEEKWSNAAIVDPSKGRAMPPLKNMQPFTLDLPGVGPVVFVSSARARRLSIVLRPFAGVRVSMPRGMALAPAAAFVRSKQPWLTEKVEEMRRLEQELAARYPRGSIIDWATGGERLALRLAELAARHGYQYGRLSVRCQKSRWGSCSSRNDISLNRKLLALPPELMDFVLLHELVHTRIKNHGPEFWAELERVAGNARQNAARLREYHLAVL